MNIWNNKWNQTHGISELKPVQCTEKNRILTDTNWNYQNTTQTTRASHCFPFS